MSYITVVRPTSAYCGKVFNIDQEGNVTKSRGMAPAKCDAYTIPCEDLHALANIINQLSPGMAIILGYVEEAIGRERFHLWSKQTLTDHFLNGDVTKVDQMEPHELIIYQGSELYLPRLKSLFTPAPFICLDRDIDDNAPEQIASVQKMNNAEYLSLFKERMGDEISDAFMDVSYLTVESSSAQVYFEDGTPYKSETAAHIFFQVEDAKDIERFSMALACQVMANGYSYISEVPNKNGGVAARKKMIYDPSVFTLGRLFFESSPLSLTPKLKIEKKPCLVTPHNKQAINTKTIRDPNGITRLNLQKQNVTFRDTHFESVGLSETLLIDTEKYGSITVAHYRDNIKEKVRCQTPFRESTSWAAYLNRHTDGTVYLWDEGTRTKYSLGHDDKAELEKMRKSALEFFSSASEIKRLAKECGEELADELRSSVAPEPTADEIEALALEADSLNKEEEKHTFHTSRNRKYLAMSVADWEQQDLRTPEEMTLWGDRAMICGGVTILGGAPKVGKTAFLMQMLLAAACGEEFLGAQFKRPYKVLWFQAEIPPEFLRERMREGLLTLPKEKRKLAAQNLIATQNKDLELNSADMPLYIDLLEEHKPDIVCIDPIRNLLLIKSENEAPEMKKLFSAMKTAGTEIIPDLSLIFAHHTRKDSSLLESKSGTVPHDLYSGSGSLRGFYDLGLMMLSDAQHHNTKHLHFEVRHGPTIEPVQIHRDGVAFALGSAIETSVRSFINDETLDKEQLARDFTKDYLDAGKNYSKDHSAQWSYLSMQVQNRLVNEHGIKMQQRNIKKYCEKDSNFHFFKQNGNKYMVFYG